MDSACERDVTTHVLILLGLPVVRVACGPNILTYMLDVLGCHPYLSYTRQMTVVMHTYYMVCTYTIGYIYDGGAPYSFLDCCVLVSRLRDRDNI